MQKEFGIEVSDRSLKRLLKQMGLSTVPKPSNTEKNWNDSAGSSKILIRDLKSSNVADNTEFLPINLAKLGTDSEIHGAKSITVVSATARAYIGVFSFGNPISALS